MPDRDICLKNFHGVPIALDDLAYFFVFCPNNSGTTVLSQYLAGQIGGYLPPFGHNEGQMAPRVRETLRDGPWDATRRIDWRFIRREWDALRGQQVFVEASPPNLIRTDAISGIFGQDSTAVVSICDPYQQISSSVRNYQTPPGDFAGVARDWVDKARTVMRLRQTHPFFPFISYEDFVADPGVVNTRLGLPWRKVDVAGKKGSDIEGIRSGRARAIGFLTPPDIAAIDTVLTEARDLLACFGYAVGGPEMLEAVRATTLDEFGIGLEKRRMWETRHPPPPRPRSWRDVVYPVKRAVKRRLGR